MKEEMKEGIFIFGLFLILFIIIGSIFYFVMIGPSIALADKQNRIKSLFKESDFNISDDLEIKWIGHIGYSFNYYSDTDWCYWEVEVYNECCPYQNSEIELWLNIETEECYYVGELP